MHILSRLILFSPFFIVHPSNSQSLTVPTNETLILEGLSYLYVPLDRDILRIHVFYILAQILPILRAGSGSSRLRSFGSLLLRHPLWASFKTMHSLFCILSRLRHLKDAGPNWEWHYAWRKKSVLTDIERSRLPQQKMNGGSALSGEAFHMQMNVWTLTLSQRVLMSLDRLISSFSGRQCVLQEEGYDVDRPIECDDEYWDLKDSSLAFQQPPNKPSTIAYFNSYLKLMEILAYAMRVIYSVKKSTFPSSGQSAPYLDQKIIMNLDSAMNSWMDSVPDHLRWNASSQDEVFLKQSATLYATYYHLQIFIHRPFIPSFRNPSSTTFPSLAICTNAARSCCHVLEVQSRTSLPLPTLQVTIFTAAVVLLLNIWSGKRSGFAPYPKREIDDVQRCLNLLKTCERRWCSAGRYWDILMDLASAGDLSFSDGSASVDSGTGTKRPREPVSVVRSPIWYTPEAPQGQRKIAGLRRVSAELSSDGDPAVLSSQTLRFELPMYATELGRLPVYGQFNFSESCKRPRHDPASYNSSFSVSSRGEANPGGVPYPSSGLVSMNVHPTQSQYSVPSEWGQYSAPQGPDHDTKMPFYPGPGECEVDGVPLVDSDMLTMWSTAPTGFE
ncbi:hypothetical protein D9615_002627 [Tricholomella constricta]|uniref:Transcription factor domain-containing protein n=1 Tax=Tricholomella constricta TaxID=117010 RepID=A0A8H5HMB9_9AGAR|nr:hypothetical protein D9615_002627 [Tricholomella constricta]